MSLIAVLTNDLQYELVEKNQERLQAVEEFKPFFCNFLDQIREMGHLVVHLQLINDPNDPNAERYDGHLPVQKGSQGAEVIAEFLHPDDIIMEKSKDSGFFDTDLDKVLKEKGVETVVVTGMQTQICVQTTAADAFFRGFNVWVPDDGVVSARAEDKERALTWLDGYCATVSTTDEIIRTLGEHGELPRKKVYIP
ncbi:cysteine hydrolase [Photobacterium sp. GJ3]|uniref:isochorismatase family cysteine hydrolase n=1 Tax=Photobacterium sp. GJ3 TaxID=2829502 RepID=UPI001B8D40F3|nr:isochorismatase family cysteine hydrolase [Photobacterium sp. GJ3]QUJ66590.1 cysteine hydrolase [Photobacterium sp. GJ3]